MGVRDFFNKKTLIGGVLGVASWLTGTAPLAGMIMGGVYGYKKAANSENKGIWNRIRSTVLWGVGGFASGILVQATGFIGALLGAGVGGTAAAKYTALQKNKQLQTSKTPQRKEGKSRSLSPDRTPGQQKHKGKDRRLE